MSCGINGQNMANQLANVFLKKNSKVKNAPSMNPPDQESGKRAGTGVWEWLFGRDFRD